MLIAALWWAQTVVIPVVISLLLSYALEPTVARLEMLRLPRAVGAPLVLMVLLGATGAGIWALRGEAEAFAYRLPEGAHTIAQAVRTKTAGTSGPWARMQQAAKELETAAGTRQTRSTDGVQSVRIEEPTFRWNEWIWQGSHGVFALVTQTHRRDLFDVLPDDCGRRLQAEARATRRPFDLRQEADAADSFRNRSPDRSLHLGARRDQRDRGGRPCGSPSGCSGWKTPRFPV